MSAVTYNALITLALCLRIATADVAAAIAPRPSPLAAAVFSSGNCGYSSNICLSARSLHTKEGMDQRRSLGWSPIEDFLSLVAWQWNETVIQERVVSRVSQSNLIHPSFTRRRCSSHPSLLEHEEVRRSGGAKEVGLASA